MPVPVAACPSGLVTVMSRAPAAAPAAMVRLRVTCVTSVNVTLFTVTPDPLAEAVM